MDLHTFLRRFSLVRLSIESVILIAAMMALKTHSAIYDHYSYSRPVTETSGPGAFMVQSIAWIQILWLFFYFMVPRVITGYVGIIMHDARCLMMHIILTIIIIAIQF